MMSNDNIDLAAILCLFGLGLGFLALCFWGLFWEASP